MALIPKTIHDDLQAKELITCASCGDRIPLFAVDLCDECEGPHCPGCRGNDVDPERMDEWLEEFMSSPLPEQFVSEETAAVCVGGAWGKIALDDICALKQDVEDRWTSYVKQ